MAGTKSKENPPLPPIPWPIVPQLFYSLTVKEWLTVRKLVLYMKFAGVAGFGMWM